jgi:ABC-type transport system involved in multi-copper enzyme maturation permease subunit
MLWYKSWLETRWRFLIGLGLLTLSAAGTVLYYPTVVDLLPLASSIEINGELGRRLAESVALSRDYRGYVWSQWFVNNVPELWALFAVLLGTGGLLSQGPRGGALFTLSLPVSRGRLIGVRAATGLAELLAMALVSSLVLTMLSPAVGQTYSLGDALVHGACLFIAGTVLFSLATLLSTVFNDVWRPALIVLCGATLVAFCETAFRDLGPYSLFGTMSGELYFRRGELPWLGLLVSILLSATFLYASTRNIRHQDF